LAVSLNTLIIEALQRAAAAPEGLPLLSSKAAPGLFAGGAAAKQAALACKERGLLHVVRTQTKGRTALEVCALTEEGWRRLLEESNPRPVLDALRSALDQQTGKLSELTAAAHAQQAAVDAIRLAVSRVEEHLRQRTAPPFPLSKNGTPPLEETITQALGAWHQRQPMGDCPLPELLRGVRATSPGSTIGRFHDALRRLTQERVLSLHPWTGPLYEMPEPEAALLVGHEIAYYASLRDNATN
jgi:hypothetical protein